MGFDDEVDQLKKELQTPKLDAAGRKSAMASLCSQLQAKIQSRRLEFNFDESADAAITILHVPSKEKLAVVTVNDDGSVTFQSSDSDQDDDDPEDAGYFPPYVEYYDEEEFLEEAPEMLKQGVAEFELDQEDDD